MSYSPLKYISTMKYHLEYVPDILNKYSKVLTWTKKKNFQIADIGSGPGHLLAKLEPYFPQQYAEIIGLDKSSDMVNYFNAVPKDPRISARQLDIETEELPNDLKGRFDFAFSSYSFHYVKDVRKALKNTSQLLKTNGELLFIWCKRCHMYEIYNSLSKMDQWSTYTNDFKNWKNYFDNENPLSTVEMTFNQVGLKILGREEIKDIYFKEEKAQGFLELFDSLDAISSRIPKYNLQKYKEDFHKLVLSELIEDNTETGLKFKIHVPTLVVAAKKI